MFLKMNIFDYTQNLLIETKWPEQVNLKTTCYMSEDCIFLGCVYNCLQQESVW